MRTSSVSSAATRASSDRPASPPRASDYRVLVVAPEPVYEDRGTPIAVRKLVEALREISVAVDVLTYPLGKPLDLDGVRVFRSSNPLGLQHVPIGLSLRKLILDVGLTWRLWRLVRGGRYDCIHAVEEAAFPATWLARRHGAAVIYDMQSDLLDQLAEHRVFALAPVQRVLRACEAWLLRNVDYVVSSTGLVVRTEAGRASPDHRELRYPNRLEPPSPSEAEALRRRLGIAPEAPVVVYCGNFQPYQGVPLLLEAAGGILSSFPDAVFLLVGREPGPRGGLGDGLAAELPPDSVRVVDRQAREDIGDFLAVADVLVSPRRRGHNLPLKIFDYLGAGRPIVATDIPAHRALLDTDTALLVPPTSEGLERGIVELLADRARAAELAEAADIYARRHLGWSAFVDSIATVYSRVREGRSAPRQRSAF